MAKAVHEVAGYVISRPARPHSGYMPTIGFADQALRV
jgi:hypothetical protein